MPIQIPQSAGVNHSAISTKVASSKPTKPCVSRRLRLTNKNAVPASLRLALLRSRV